ncbi:MAG: hypothetical protein ACRD8Z_06530 [Nitrososphaeraceae archaeon]
MLDYWPYLLLMIPSLFVLYPFLGPGDILTGDFPALHNAIYPSKLLHTWIDFGSHNNFEILPRYPLIAAGHVLTLIQVSSELISRFMLISGFLLSSFSFYFCSAALLKNKANTQTSLKVAAIIGSLFYAYNVWSFGRIHHWYIWIGYAVLPLFFISVIFAFQNPKKWRYIITAVLSFSLASSTPHMIIVFGLFLVGISLYFIANSFLKRQFRLRTGITLLVILSFYTLLNSYWIYPFIVSINSGDLDTSSSFGYIVTEETTESFSFNSYLSNTLRGLDDYQLQLAPSESSPLYLFWMAAGFVVPALAFSALLSRRFFRYSIVFSLIAVVGIFLSMGSNAPFDFYSTLLFGLPFLSEYNALFRDPNKWAILITFSYSMLLSIISFKVLNFAKKIRPKKVLAGLYLIVIVGSIAITSYFPYRFDLIDSFEPVTIPNDLGDLNRYLQTLNIDKVLYLPYFPGYSSSTWNNLIYPNELFELASTKANLGYYPILSQNYYRYLSNLIMTNKTDNVNRLFTPYGTSHLIYHNDTDSAENVELFTKLSSLDELKKVRDVGIFEIFKSDNNDNSTVNISKLDVAAIGGLEKLTLLNSLDSFSVANSSILFLDQDTKIHDDSASMNPTDILVLSRNADDDLFLALTEDKYIARPFDIARNYDPTKLWSKSGTTDPMHGEFHPYLEGLGIENWDFDYRKGLVMTSAVGERLVIPIEITESTSYDIFIRYLKNEAGGRLKVYLDDILLEDIVSKEDKSNRFVWENIASNLNLPVGEHRLTLENVYGFNAVNLFAVLPRDQSIGQIESALSLANGTRNVFLLEAESDFTSTDSANYTTMERSANYNNQNGFDYNAFIQTFANQSDVETLDYSASDNGVLVLTPGSSADTSLEILKSSNYTVAVRANICDTCLPLKISMEDDTGSIITAGDSNSNNSSQLDDRIINSNNTREQSWSYSNHIYLNEGRYNMRISSDSSVEIDSVVIYSTNDDEPYETLDGVFNPPNSSAAEIVDYEKIEPTKYLVTIKNATRPYVISFAESYDPLWSAHISTNDIHNDNTKLIKNFPAYSFINGFSIERLGDYSLIIEFRPQKWFTEGAIISTVTVVVTILAHYLIKRRNIFRYFSGFSLRFRIKSI